MEIGLCFFQAVESLYRLSWNDIWKYFISSYLLPLFAAMQLPSIDLLV